MACSLGEEEPSRVRRGIPERGEDNAMHNWQRFRLLREIVYRVWGFRLILCAGVHQYSMMGSAVRVLEDIAEAKTRLEYLSYVRLTVSEVRPIPVEGFDNPAGNQIREWTAWYNAM